MSNIRHLVSVWNPSYSRTAMDQHLEVLLDWALGDPDDGEPIAAEDVYVWWGKVKSPNRQKPQAHADDIRSAAKMGKTAEVHLYLTDYRALYVGRVIDVLEAQLPEDELEHVPEYYAEDGLTCDFWFKLADIRRLVADDTNQVVEELKKLKNIHYNDRPVSIYGGMVNLPLVVTRNDDVSFFADTQIIDGQLWAAVDASAGSGIAGMERELRDNRFGPSLWNALDPASRTFIATGERIWRDHHSDPAFDLSPVVVSFAKAFEAHVSALLRAVLPGVEARHRIMNVDGESVDLLKRPPVGLGAIARAIDDDRERFDRLEKLLKNGSWFVRQLPSRLREISDLRNPSAHTSKPDLEDVRRLRDQLIGVGCLGDFVQLAGVRVGEKVR